MRLDVRVTALAVVVLCLPGSIDGRTLPAGGGASIPPLTRDESAHAARAHGVHAGFFPDLAQPIVARDAIDGDAALPDSHRGGGGDAAALQSNTQHAEIPYLLYSCAGVFVACSLLSIALCGAYAACVSRRSNSATPPLSSAAHAATSDSRRPRLQQRLAVAQRILLLAGGLSIAGSMAAVVSSPLAYGTRGAAPARMIRTGPQLQTMHDELAADVAFYLVFGVLTVVGTGLVLVTAHALCRCDGERTQHNRTARRRLSYWNDVMLPAWGLDTDADA